MQRARRAHAIPVRSFRSARERWRSRSTAVDESSASRSAFGAGVLSARRSARRGATACACACDRRCERTLDHGQRIGPGELEPLELLAGPAMADLAEAVVELRVVTRQHRGPRRVVQHDVVGLAAACRRGSVGREQLARAHQERDRDCDQDSEQPVASRSHERTDTTAARQAASSGPSRATHDVTTLLTCRPKPPLRRGWLRTALVPMRA